MDAILDIVAQATEVLMREPAQTGLISGAVSGFSIALGLYIRWRLFTLIALIMQMVIVFALPIYLGGVSSKVIEIALYDTAAFTLLVCAFATFALPRPSRS